MRSILHPAFREKTTAVHITPSLSGTSSTLSGHAIQLVSLQMHHPSCFYLICLW